MIYVANWKMNRGFKEAQNFLMEFKNKIPNQDSFVFLPPALLSGLFQKENLHWGAQNVFLKSKGAFTGENSASVLKEMGAQFCLVGHSERRYSFGETDTEIQRKFDLIHQHQLIPILCIGELIPEKTERDSALKKQLSWLKTYEKYQKLSTDSGRPEAFKKIPFIVAYEPVWAIGTGKTPDPFEVNETHHKIKEYLQIQNVPVFYGGSVNSENAQAFSQQKHVDGFLLGGASLDLEELNKVYERSSS